MGRFSAASVVILGESQGFPGERPFPLFVLAPSRGWAAGRYVVVGYCPQFLDYRLPRSRDDECPLSDARSHLGWLGCDE